MNLGYLGAMKHAGASLLLLAAALLAGCGGKVVVDEPSSAGGGGSTSGTSSGTSTSAGAAEYRGFTVYTDVGRYVLLKKDTAADRCTVMTVATLGSSGFHIQTTQGWQVEFAWMTQGASFCDLLVLGTYPPLPTVYAKALDGVGDLKQDSSAQPCTVSAAFTLDFDGSQPWAPATDDWSATGIGIEGACSD